MFLAIGNKDLNLTQKVLQNPGYSKSELDLLRSANALFKIHRSSTTFNNIVFTTNYDTIVTTMSFLHPIELREKSLNIFDAEFRTEGVILATETTFNWKMEKVTIDAYRNTQVFYVFIL